MAALSAGASFSRPADGPHDLEPRGHAPLPVAEQRRQLARRRRGERARERLAKDGARRAVVLRSGGHRVGDRLERGVGGDRRQDRRHARARRGVVAQARGERGRGALAALELLVRLARRLALGLAEPRASRSGAASSHDSWLAATSIASARPRASRPS